MTTNRADIYQTVTDTIIEAIENGISSNIEMPWHQINRIPENVRTRNHYQGINIPLLWVHQIKKITPCLYGEPIINGQNLAHR